MNAGGVEMKDKSVMRGYQHNHSDLSYRAVAMPVVVGNVPVEVDHETLLLRDRSLRTLDHIRQRTNPAQVERSPPAVRQANHGPDAGYG